MLSIVRFFAFVLSIIVLTACGGGGGGGSASDLSLNTTSVSFTANQNGAVPTTQTLSASWSGANVAAILAGYPPNTTPPSWLDISIPGSSNPLPIELSINTTNLAPGTYSTTVRVVSVDANANAIDIIDVSVSLTIQAKLGLTGSPSLSFNMIDGGSAPASQGVGLVGDGISWTASASQSWVQLGSTSGTAPSNVSIGVNPTALSVGTHTASVTFTDTASSDTAIVNITLNIQPPIGASTNALAFHMVSGGSAPANQSITLTGTGLAWNASTSASWVQLGSTSGTAPSNVSVGINPAGLGVGTHNASISFSDTANIQTVTVDITLNIQDRLGISGSTSLNFAMVDSGMTPLDQTVSLTGTDVNWVAKPSEAWLVLGSNTGTSPGDISIGVNPATLNAGIHNATVVFSDDQSLQSVSLNVELRIEPHRLSVEDNGVALTSTPGLSVLSSTVEISENAGVTTPWSATSDATWLSVTASGSSGNDLTMTADPSGLAADTIHYARISVTSSATSISNSETIRVGLWVGSATANASDSLNLTYTELEADPIRPYVYMHDNGTAIDIYNVHTAALVTTINNVAAQLGDMEISTDGSTLYVADLTNQDIVPVNLDTRVAGTAWDLTSLGSLSMAFGRVDNKDLLFVADGSIRDAADGTALSSTHNSGQLIDVSQSGKMLCGVRTGVSPYSIACSGLSYSELGTGSLTLSGKGTVRGPGGNAKDIALLRDGSRAYVASGAPYSFIGFNSETMVQDQTLPANPYPNSIAVSSDNLVYGGTFTWYGSLNGDQDVWIYASDGVLQNSHYVSGYAEEIRDRQLVVSGDGLRMVISVTDPAIKMMTSK